MYTFENVFVVWKMYSLSKWIMITKVNVNSFNLTVIGKHLTGFLKRNLIIIINAIPD